MPTNKILGALAATTVLAFGLDCAISDGKLLFGGTTPSTISNKEWEEEGETEKRLQAWPRTAGPPPVVMNPISRQKNFIVKARSE